MRLICENSSKTFIDGAPIVQNILYTFCTTHKLSIVYWQHNSKDSFLSIQIVSKVLFAKKDASFLCVGQHFTCFLKIISDSEIGKEMGKKCSSLQLRHSATWKVRHLWFLWLSTSQHWKMNQFPPEAHAHVENWCTNWCQASEWKQHTQSHHQECFCAPRHFGFITPAIVLWCLCTRLFNLHVVWWKPFPTHPGKPCFEAPRG